MPSPLVFLALGATLLVAGSDAVPNFDARPGCQAGAQSGVEFQPNIAACVQDEQQAKDSLVKEWQQFSMNDKSECVANVESGGPPSYIELLTCLEIARNAASID